MRKKCLFSTHLTGTWSWLQNFLSFHLLSVLWECHCGRERSTTATRDTKAGKQQPCEGLQPSRSPRLKAKQSQTERKKSAEPPLVLGFFFFSSKEPAATRRSHQGEWGSSGVAQWAQNIWQTLGGLNECCSRDVEHPRILETDCAVCTFLWWLIIK